MLLIVIGVLALMFGFAPTLAYTSLAGPGIVFALQLAALFQFTPSPRPVQIPTGAGTEISQSPRPCVPAARMPSVWLYSRSRTCTLGKPLASFAHVLPKLFVKNTPLSVPT